MTKSLLTLLFSLFISMVSAAEIVTTGGKCAHEKLFLVHQLAENSDLPKDIGTEIIKAINLIGWRTVPFPSNSYVWAEFLSNKVFAFGYCINKVNHFEFEYGGITFRSSIYPSKLKDVFFRRLFLENGKARAHYVAKSESDKFGICEMHFYLTPLLHKDEGVFFVDPKYLKEAAPLKPVSIPLMGTRLMF